MEAKAKSLKIILKYKTEEAGNPSGVKHQALDTFSKYKDKEIGPEAHMRGYCESENRLSLI